MLTPEEYHAFEQEQSTRWQREQSKETPSMQNHERWQVTRYDNNLKRYFITAREELGTQFKAYADRGYWQGAREFENRMFEELQYHYRNHQGIRVTRTTVNENCRLYEVTQQIERTVTPKLCVMILDGERIYSSKPHRLKDGYRYRMEAQ